MGGALSFPNGERRIIGSLGHGSMANGPPQAVGAPFTGRDRQVVSMSGDGGFSMPRGDFLTLVQYHLPVKVVLFINSASGMVELEMSVSGLPAHGATYRDPGLAALARAAGAYGVRVVKPEQLTGASRPAFRHPGRARGGVVTDPAALSVPPKKRVETVAGCVRSASKIVWAAKGAA